MFFLIFYENLWKISYKRILLYFQYCVVHWEGMSYESRYTLRRVCLDVYVDNSLHFFVCMVVPLCLITVVVNERKLGMVMRICVCNKFQVGLEEVDGEHAC